MRRRRLPFRIRHPVLRNGIEGVRHDLTPWEPHHLLTHQMLSVWNVAEMAGLAVLTAYQQAQGKHGKKCRGAHSKVVDRVDTPLSPMPFRMAVRMVRSGCAITAPTPAHRRAVLVPESSGAEALMTSGWKAPSPHHRVPAGDRALR